MRNVRTNNEIGILKQGVMCLAFKTFQVTTLIIKAMATHSHVSGFFNVGIF